MRHSLVPLHDFIYWWKECVFFYSSLSHLMVLSISYSRSLTTKQLLQLVLLACVWACMSYMMCKGYIMILCCTELESECLKGVHWNKCLYCMLVMSICHPVLHFKKRENNTEVTISYVHLKNCERNENEKGNCIIFQKEGGKKNIFLIREL